jgi:hypothetical protein
MLLGDGSDHRVDAEDGMCWLRSTAFDGLVGDPDATRNKAEGLLALINGAAKLRFAGFQPVELGTCVDWVPPDGGARRRLRDTVIVHVRSNRRATEEDRKDGVGDDIERWVTLGRHDEKVADVLRVWGSRHAGDWSTLFKLKEKIDAAVGGSLVERGWATKRELERFNRTANSHRILGDAARHGVQTSEPPAKPMTIEQARQLIDRLIRRWFERLGATMR